MKRQRRPKGEGSITKLPSGNYRMLITIGTGIDGKQKRKSVTAKTKAELLQKVSMLRLQCGQKTERVLKVSELVSLFMQAYETQLAANTIKNYRSTIKAVLYPIYNKNINDVTGEVLDHILDTIKQKDNKAYNVSTLQSFKKKVAAIFNYAVHKHWLSHSPTSDMRKRKKGDTKANKTMIPTEGEMKEILKQAMFMDKEKEKCVPLYPFFLLAVSTGMRIGELIDLKWSDINMKRHTIDIHHQCTLEGTMKPLKTSSSYRIIYVSPKVLEVIYNKCKHDCDYVWSINGHRIAYSTIANTTYRALRDEIDVPKGFTFHSFRHYHATQLLMKGIDVKEVSKRLGHSSIKTTLDLYTHWLPEADERAAKALGDQYVL